MVTRKLLRIIYASYTFNTKEMEDQWVKSFRSSFPRKRESGRINKFWIPASAGMTEMRISCYLFVVCPLSENRRLREVIR
jgi:hypothetical protein